MQHGRRAWRYTVLAASLVWGMRLDIRGEISFEFHATSDGGLPRVTASCRYSAPERDQLDALLGNMMNGLTEIYSDVQEYVSEDSSRREQKRRFRVVSQSNSSFFERIYSDMSDEYRKLYEETRLRMESGEVTSCERLRGMWARLLRRAAASLRRAAARCVRRAVRGQRALGGDRRRELWRRVKRRVSRVATLHLHTLCDRFQLCFHDDT